MKKITVEICAGSVEDCIAAKTEGADRVELNSGTYLGGLTPTPGTLSLTKETCPGLLIISMVRPRGGGFCYSDFEFETMKRDARELLKNGSDGIVFGILNEDKTLDIERNKALCDLALEYGKTPVFHRAFDCVSDRDACIEGLIKIGIKRVLTSGGAHDAFAGRGEIARLINTYGDKIEILPGAGINKDNVLELIKNTGTTQIHSSCRNWFYDPTTVNSTVSYGFDKEHPSSYDGCDKDKIRDLVATVSKAC